MSAYASRLSVFDEKRVLWVLVTGLIIVGFSYAYFLNSAVSHVIMRERILEKTTALNGSVNELEFRYIALQSAIGLERAFGQGFVIAQKPHYVSRTPFGKGLTVRSVRN